MTLDNIKEKIDIVFVVRIAPVVFVFIVLIIFSILSPSFLKLRNAIEILQISAIYLLFATGVTFPILMGSIDLSISGIIVASGVIAMTLAPTGGFWTVVLTLIIGLVLGVLNGFLTAKLKLPSFIVTLSTMFIYSGIATAITGGYNIDVRSNGFSAIANGRIIPGIPNIIIWALLVYLGSVLFSEKTIIGRYIFAIGGKEDVASRMGINIAKYKIIAFGISGILIGAGTVLLSSRIGMASARLGSSYLFNTLIAVVVGGTALSGGVGGVRYTILGVVIITILENGMNLIGVDIRIQYIIKAAILIGAVFLLSIPKSTKQTIMK